MVDREQNLGQDRSASEYDIPHPRPGETATPRKSYDDEHLKELYGDGHSFVRTKLKVTGKGVEETGIGRTYERIEVFDLDSDGDPVAIRAVLTGYASQRRDGRRVKIDLFGNFIGTELGVQLAIFIEGFDMEQHVRSAADRGMPLAMSPDGNYLVSQTPAGLLADLESLGKTKGLSSYERGMLRFARGVATRVKRSFRSEHPATQPGRAKIIGQ